MTTLAKRPLDHVFAADGDDNRAEDHAAASPLKRQCRASPAGPTQIVAGDQWDGIECDDDDIAARDAIVAAALADDFSIENLIAALAGASTYQVELAMVQLFPHGLALSRLCRAIAAPSPTPHTVSVDALLYRAARDGCPRAVGALVIRMAEEDDVERALSAAVDDDDVAAVEMIVHAYENDTNTPIESCRRVTCNALRDAVEFGKVAAVGYLGGLCDGETVEELLAECAANNADDPKAAVFAALWRHADLCAHAYGKSLPPGPALDYLQDFVESGESCADGCMSNVADDSDSDNDTDDDDGDGRDDEHNDNNDDNNSDDDEGVVDRPDNRRPL